ncbi:DUF5330 domain-containing protein [Afifella sp. IM 167]|uniref:DUF5330 domain-containing protein n=1 Tax=Afifella sp. IM 167 TaxID=2033586 RepID=UPI001CCFF0CE|nr:DUF5330 domain-containing protein [Afifella sp. IM 167]MBZ8133100.1 hypothetical protein [Afifella sp. IM 167]
MFVFRSIFWLTTLVLVLPPSEEGGPPPRVSLLQSAAAVRVLAQDVRGLCDRHPQACETSWETLTLLGRKLETGRHVAAAALGSAQQEEAEKGTLTDADLSVPWTAGESDVAAAVTEPSVARPHEGTSAVGLPLPRPQLL